jgi:site-specific recombinase XerD
VGILSPAYRTALAKGELGIVGRQPAPTLKDFAIDSFLPYVASTFAEQPNTKEFYEYGAKCLVGFEKLTNERLESITGKEMNLYVAHRQKIGNSVTTINRQLQVLRRMFALAMEWKVVQTKLERVKMIPGEHRRDRVLSPEEEAIYFSASRSGSTAMQSTPTPRYWPTWTPF